MLDNADNFCKVITGDDAVNKASLKALIGVNIDKDIAMALMDEPMLEVRKYKSEQKLMDNCAVVKSVTGRLWNIPHKVLERVEGKW